MYINKYICVYNFVFLFYIYLYMYICIWTLWVSICLNQVKPRRKARGIPLRALLRMTEPIDSKTLPRFPSSTLLPFFFGGFPY